VVTPCKDLRLAVWSPELVLIPRKIIDRIALIQDYELIVDADSTNLIKELNNYVWHDKKSETPIDDYNHLLDALGYAVWNYVGKPNAGKYYVYK